MAEIQRVESLKAPLHLSQLRDHRILKDAGFVRGRMIGRLNPPLRDKLRNYGPERLG